MFGMGNQKPRLQEPFLFDVERELKDAAKRKEYAKRIETRINKIKEHLRKGSKKEEFEYLGILLNGYQALTLVLGRAAKQAGAK